jgi:hypothetical protein
MDLIRDCLDEQLLDRQKRPMGRVDGIILTLEPGRQPRVSYIELGAITVADRISARIGRLVGRLRKWDPSTSNRFRIPMSKIKVGLNTVTADVEAEKTPALEWELWLRQKVIGRIPGA